MKQETANIIWDASRIFLRLESLGPSERRTAIDELRLILGTYTTQKIAGPNVSGLAFDEDEQKAA